MPRKYWNSVMTGMIFVWKMLCSYSSPNGARMTEFGGKLRRYGINIRLAKTDDIPNISKWLDII